MSTVHKSITLTALATFSAVIFLLGSAQAQEAKPIRIAIANSFLADRADSIVNIVAGDFNNVLKTTTGLDGAITTKSSAFEVAEKLDKKQLDFGIFHAHELAWAQQKYPDLQPLLVAANKTHVECAYLIVHKNSPAKTIADLRGKKLDLPKGTNEPCRVFVAKLCLQVDQKTPVAFFGSIEKSTGQVEALDGVARAKSHVTLVNAIWLDFYKQEKGTAFANHLRVLQQSEIFPPAAIVFKKGALDQKIVDQFTIGLRKAHTTEAGRDLMKDWNFDAFEPIPQDFAKSLADVLKAYPAP